ncbi:hypothetical protein LO771_07815 [Streptacidiphilus sp. ASG 303]|uniref:hypothetical protein n=1 Tax=Streptacidiphilus sp. ASG 303 TaxID=2896847 RepID=UPI001E314BFA|nr:hypothetical protein [Streptacidiphilus sp. ASG 303]MCD0482320.1 hypothetical protein [Streptacidiphilus sp. ASG 303]
MTDQFNRPLAGFEAMLELPYGFTARAPEPNEVEAARAIKWLENSRPKRHNFWPALTLAFVAQAEILLAKLSEQSHPNAFTSIKRRETSAARAVDQLTWVVGETEIPVRRFYNFAAEVIMVQMRRHHPSSPGHATSKWEMYKPFIESVIAASPGGRLAVAQWVWKHGVLDRQMTVSTSHRERQPRPFYEMLKDLETGSGTTGGAVFQSLVYGYLYADSPTLTVISQRVNTGSRRAGVIGDVSGFLGEHVVLAAEAKDKHLTKADEADLMTFITESSAFPDLDAVVFARSFDSYIQDVLCEAEVRCFTRNEMIHTVSLWDVPKQENAVRSVRFFLGQIQKNPSLVERVDEFIKDLYEEPV